MKLHVAQRFQDGETRIYLLRASPDGVRSRGVVVQFDDPAHSARVHLDASFDNEEFLASVSADLAQGPAELQLLDSQRVAYSLTVTQVDSFIICQSEDGATLIASSNDDSMDENAVQPAVGIVAAVAFVASVAILTIGGVGVAAMNGVFSGSASSSGEGTAVTVEASAEKPE